MKFRNIIILMLITMIGLIAFQWYWIQNAIAVKKEQFDRNVNDALQETVKKIEKQEIIYLTKQKIKAEEQKKLLALTQKKSIKKRIRNTDFPKLNQEENPAITQKKDETKVEVMPDGSNQFFTTFPTEISSSPYLLEIPDRQMDLIREMLEEQDMIWEDLSQRNRSLLLRQRTIQDLMRTFDTQFSRMSRANEDRKNKRIYSNRPIQVYEIPEANSPIYFSNDSVWVANVSKENIRVEEPKTNIEKIANYQKQNKPKPKPVSEQNLKSKAEVVKNAMSDVLIDVLQEKRNIHERVDKQTIDTLLKKELLGRGINIPYHYGVKNSSKMIFTSFAVNYNPNLLDNAYKAQLFPSDATPQNHFLYVYFTSNQGFILRNLWAVFASSGLLILLIGGIFYTSIQTMFQQKKLAESKNDFINNMTHEFKTPISTISLAVEVMKDNEVKKDSLKMNRYLNIIQDENRRLGTQVEKVLQMALLDKGEVKLKLGNVNIHETIEQVLNNLSVQIEQKNGIVNFELDAENPEIEADEVHLTNIIYNLLDNANKYSPENPEITIKTENVENGLKISISDKGIGMTRDQIDRIFEKFYRVSTGNLHDVKGFGLGLSYVKKMVDSHNGKIEVASKLGEGSTFEIWLPKLHS